MKYRLEVQKVLNGYHYEIYDEYSLVGVIYGSTNAMWDFVLGAKDGLEISERILAQLNNQT